MAVAGIGADCLLNTILLLLGVLPSHIHAFYITCTYFSRKAKVRKGQYPGGPKMGIYSERVWYGGASARRVGELWEGDREGRFEKEDGKSVGRKSRKGKGGRCSGRSEVVRMRSDAGVRVHSSDEKGDGRVVGRSRTMI